MTKDQLMAIMIAQIKNIILDKKEVSEDTIHADVLDSYDGKGGVSSAEIYKSFIRYHIKHSEMEDKQWTSDWLSLTVSKLADQLL